jgi:hypothetical protein
MLSYSISYEQFTGEKKIVLFTVSDTEKPF